MAGVSGYLGTQREQKLTGLGVPLDNGFSGNDVAAQGLHPDVGTLRRGLLSFDFSKPPEARPQPQPQPQGPGIVVAPNINPNIIGGGPGGQPGAGGPGGQPVYINFQPHVEGGTANPIAVSGNANPVGSFVNGSNIGGDGAGAQHYTDNKDTGYLREALRVLNAYPESPAGTKTGGTQYNGADKTGGATRKRNPSESAGLLLQHIGEIDLHEFKGKTTRERLATLDGIVTAGAERYLAAGKAKTKREGREMTGADIERNHLAGRALGYGII